jgi:ATP-dependent exoDNAse (exonuclease V) alpha subunit
MEILPEYRQIEQALHKHPLIFVTGQAGTGKSTFIHYLHQVAGNLVALAPTGVAALNVKGMTIHSFFGIPASHVTPEEFTAPNPIRLHYQKKTIIRNTKILVIDEVSMLLPNILDSIDKILQNINKNDKPFGGVSVVLIGDLLQLPPIVASEEEAQYFSHRYASPHFFSADILKKIPLKTFFLTEHKRQTDSSFISILNAIRHNKDHREKIKILNNRCYKEKAKDVLKQEAIYLVTTNKRAKEINLQKLQALPEKTFTFEAEINGAVKKQGWNLPASYLLELKVGARVMFLKNKKPDWINGDFGWVVRFSKKHIIVQKDDGQEVEVGKDSWEKYKYTYDRKQKSISKEVVGTFLQLPLALGWASTIHKTQGLSFHKIIIDLERGAFCTGQTYVALSRCRSLEGVTLVCPIGMRDVQADNTVMDFLKNLSEEENLLS